ncbi:MAG: hypothetical protein LRZ91_02555 [Desulfotomaculum sp.]|nr:hypothetical protein [Desulfotomaculum sp.]MCL0071690.1 hypothetical protein [Peptococcaceae bacterium]MCL0101126.1 hypothetical protein [Peptococcaceae bacterium]MCL0106151.1 hypothetical protein [Peptococcaceae bacterium]
MEKFAFVIHPLELSDVLRKFNSAKYTPKVVLEKILKLAPVFTASHITGVREKAKALC